MNQSVRRYVPRGRRARELRELIQHAERFFAGHDVNVVRSDLGENPATSIWLSGQGPMSDLPAFCERFEVGGALIAGNVLVRGLGQLLGWEVCNIAGVNGLPSTDYTAKGQAAVAALDRHDLVCVHVESPRLAGWLGRPADKVAALEAIDRLIVAPIVSRLEQEEGWRLLVIPSEAGAASPVLADSDRTILLMAGSGIDSNRGTAFHEDEALNGEFHPDRAWDMMPYFLHR